MQQGFPYMLMRFDSTAMLRIRKSQQHSSKHKAVCKRASGLLYLENIRYQPNPKQSTAIRFEVGKLTSAWSKTWSLIISIYRDLFCEKKNFLLRVPKQLEMLAVLYHIVIEISIYFCWCTEHQLLLRASYVNASMFEQVLEISVLSWGNGCITTEFHLSKFREIPNLIGLLLLQNLLNALSVKYSLLKGSQEQQIMVIRLCMSRIPIG